MLAMDLNLDPQNPHKAGVICNPRTPAMRWGRDRRMPRSSWSDWPDTHSKEQ